MTGHMDAPQGLTELEDDVYRLTVVNRLSQRAIGERLDLSQQRVSQILADARAKLPPIDLEAIRQDSIRLHTDIQRRALALAELAGAPVTSGKDGDVLYDPDGNVIVRDYAGRMAALKLAADSDKEIRKLLGADAATKQEISGSVQYQLVGIDLDKL